MAQLFLIHAQYSSLSAFHDSSPEYIAIGYGPRASPCNELKGGITATSKFFCLSATAASSWRQRQETPRNMSGSRRTKPASQMPRPCPFGSCSIDKCEVCERAKNGNQTCKRCRSGFRVVWTAYGCIASLIRVRVEPRWLSPHPLLAAP